jgi:predicted dehydrogenase/aryl-alcohol dehydrogenase-like predicted oxidoreductase
MDQNKKVNWGIISTGAIAKTFARNLAAAKTGRLVAVASRSQASADAFAAEFKVPRAHASYEAILADRDIDAVYIAPPHPWHAEWAIKAARAGKHVLVEKPAGINHAQLMAMIEAAVASDVFFMEAFMYRCHPQTAKLIELIKSKTIGEVRVIQSAFSFHAGFNADSRLFSNALTGGGILDVGCYPMSISRLIAGAATGEDFADPIEVKGAGHLGQTGVDEWAIASARFPGDIVAQLATGISVNQDNTLRIFGSEGRISLPNPFVCNRTAPEQGKIIVERKGEGAAREIDVEAAVTSFTYEADVAGNAILAGKKQASSPAMSWGDSLGNLRALDQWRESIKLAYDSEKPDHYSRVTVGGSPLRAAATTNMKYGRIAGLDKKISRLVMGVDNQNALPHAMVMFDDFFERGGNTFDTGFVYGQRRSELLGQWINIRGVRDQVSVLVKGAHTPFCDPKSLSTQLTWNLEWLGTDYADIYLMHRDNPEIPVGEFVDVLNEHARAGRIKVFGGSNWSLSRIDEANAYAKKKGLQGFTVVSNNFSLARMVEAPWKGCISASDADSRAWFTRTQTPLLAWSSQARGFFLPGRAAPDRLDDKEMARCWYSEDNFQRLARVNELAKKKNVLPINIALAYVLSQPFPTYALIGPRKLDETRTSLPALDVDLTPDELKWLNLEK